MSETTVVEAYCVKCKSKRPMKDNQKVTMKNGRNAMQGKCETCNTGMYKILAADKKAKE
jgi:hypothetical protein